MKCLHQKTVAECLDELESDAAVGLGDDRVAARRETFGSNELIETGGRRAWRILWEQVSGSMVVLLVVAAIVSGFLHEYTDCVVILAIVVLNAALGFVQDYRAEKALAALKKLAVPNTRVRRNGMIVEISSTELVPGDVVLLEVGNYVPADCRLIESVGLKVEEAALTGESVGVDKQVEPISGENLPLGDRTNMAFMGTIVTFGHGVAVVTEIGMNTQLGHIASSLQSVEPEPTPLQTRLARLGRSLAVVAIVIVLLVLAIGLLRGEDARLMLMTALSLAVAVVPEGLPAVATVALALGARRMFNRRALIRKLPAVETLGSVTVICSDKTGTLTQNRMSVAVLEVAGDRLDLTGLPQRDDGSAEFQEMCDRVAGNPSYSLLLTAASLCNDASLEMDESTHDLRAVGDPTEGALVVAAARFGYRNDDWARRMPRIAEIPFDSERKRMTTVHRAERRPDNSECGSDDAGVLNAITESDGDLFAFTKGAVDAMLDSCSYVLEGSQILQIDKSWQQRIAHANESLASNGMRVLGVALRRITQGQADEVCSDTSIEQEMVFVGMIGMIDPPRPEVAEAVARCGTAGIRAVMITGDHPMTALSIAQQLGITQDDRVLTARDLDGITNDELRRIVEATSVFARVAPKHKLRLVHALQQNGHVVAMTGDGVNDAPALKQAHIGLAMGITGTDVTKEASQMILLDDNFATIVNAVEEGRIVYDNIRKFVKYTMTSNMGEVCVMVIGPLLGMPLPLLPLQILWINLVTDGLPGLALALEKAEKNTMHRPPYPPGEHIFGRGMWLDIAWIGMLMAAVSLAMGFWFWAEGSTQDAHWRTIIFTILTLSQMGNALATRSAHESLFQLGIFSNAALIGSVALTACLQLLVIYWPPLQSIFKTSPLAAGELVLCVVLSTIVFWAVETQKMLARRRKAA